MDNQNANLNYFSNALIQNALTVVPVRRCRFCIGPEWNRYEVCRGTFWVPNGVTAAATQYLSIPLLVQATTTEQLVLSGDGRSKYGLVADCRRGTVQRRCRKSGGVYGFLAGSREPAGECRRFGWSNHSGVRQLQRQSGVFYRCEFACRWRAIYRASNRRVLEAGYRYSSYSEGFKTKYPCSGWNINSVQDVRLRASYQRAVRAPNILELFTPQAVLLDGSTDPCAGATPLGTPVVPPRSWGVSGTILRSHCRQPCRSIQRLTGGNPNLTPEKSDTYSVGLVFQPTFLPHLTASLDWFDIKVEDTIGGIGADTILSNCLSSGSATSVFCQAEHRDASGSLWRSPQGYVVDTNVNFGSLSTKGIDLKVNYRQDLTGLGSLNFARGDLLKSSTRWPSHDRGPAYDCTGFFGTVCGASNPSWRHVFNTTWSTPWDGLDVTLRWRYIGSVNSELTSADPQLSGKALPLTSHISAYNYLDLTAQFALYKTVRLQLGVNNLTG